MIDNVPEIKSIQTANCASFFDIDLMAKIRRQSIPLDRQIQKTMV
jgi:hypothetical protein